METAEALIENDPLPDRIACLAGNLLNVLPPAKLYLARDASELADEVRATLSQQQAELERLRRLHISFDGPYTPCKHRRWLARQLLDSKLSDAEAYSVVRPALKHTKAASPHPPTTTDQDSGEGVG